ncbi:hypothetical protein QW180_07750 [Vibrio sinaloensis]|nr:hypothetical protein [Vibrio sinaloensis]
MAECPPSKDENGEIIGEPNPHIHLVMRWSVDKSVFLLIGLNDLKHFGDRGWRTLNGLNSLKRPVLI